jgi:3'-phosphoadenosine 5'-phosphosulfate sulfotransferase (PAPS reductase)/FAD synthetase
MESWQLQQMQSLPLELKIEKTKLRIREWYEYFDGNVYVSYSGGKDSIVLLDIVRSVYPEVKAVFCDTGLEYPEVKEIINATNNVDIIRPRKSFREVIIENGYPVVSKKVASLVNQYRNLKTTSVATKHLIETGYTLDGRKMHNYKLPTKWKYLLDAPFKISDTCCDELKKKPFVRFEKMTGLRAIIGTMVSEGGWRKKQWMNVGCNAFNGKRQVSNPMSFWLESDVIEYIFKRELMYPSVYGEIVFNHGHYSFTKLNRTGCVFCLFGATQEELNRFEVLNETHPKLYEYCMKPVADGGLGINAVIEYIESNDKGVLGE